MTRLIGLWCLGAPALVASTCNAQWWWPPTDGLSISPPCVDTSTVASLTVSGEWPDNCVPNQDSVVVSGGNVEITTVREPPPGICLTVITNWSRTVSVGPLAVGTYPVFVTHRVSGQVVHPTTQVGVLQVVGSCGGGCYANCDQSTATPLLTANDFTCFLNAFTSGESYANCDGSTSMPVLTANDFACFINKYAAGCS